MSDPGDWLSQYVPTNMLYIHNCLRDWQVLSAINKTTDKLRADMQMFHLYAYAIIL